MALSDKVTVLSQELDQRQKTQRARALLQNFRSVVLETNSEIQSIVDGGNFNTLDADIKNALNDAWNVCEEAQTALEVAPIPELLDWSP